MDFFYKKIENKGPAAARIGIKGHAPLSQFLNSSFILQLRKKRKYIKQEIYISLTLYNLTQRLIRKIKIEKRNKKYIYQINFTRACHLVRSFLNKKDGKNPSLENLIANEILPIRPGRSHNRNVKRKSFIYFNYRFD